VNSDRTQSAAIAGRFLAARKQAAQLADFPGALPGSLDEAYAIQDSAMALWAKKVVGWKVGRVVPPLSAQFGTDRLAGPIFADQIAMADGSEPLMPVFADGFAAAEAEFLLHVGTPPPAGQTSFSLTEAEALIDRVHVGIEIASSPLGTINAIGPVAIVSDFGNNNGLVVGPEIPDWRSRAFEDWGVSTIVDGETVGNGRAREFPDGVFGAARFLFELLAKRGIAVEAGQWISSGAVTGVHETVPGQRVEAAFGTEYRVACRLGAASPG
jgi:2-keto-4-pentenoate hydratase